MNEDIFELCSMLDEINLKLKKIDKYVESVANVTSSFSGMGSFKPVLEEEYNKFYSTMKSCVNKVKKLNAVVEDQLLNDYDTIFRNLNVGCEEVFGEVMTTLNRLNGATSSGVDLTNAVAIENYDVHSDDIPLLGED